MSAYHHIRYAKAVRFEEPELTPFDESMLDDSTVVSCPQNKFRLDFIMGEENGLSRMRTVIS